MLGQGKANKRYNRNCLPPLPQFLHPMYRAKVSTHSNKCCVLPVEISSGSLIQTKSSCGRLNLTARLKQKEAGAGAETQSRQERPKIAPIKGSCQATGNLKPCPALFPGFAERICFIETWTAPISSKFLETCLLLANFPETLATRAACKQAQGVYRWKSLRCGVTLMPSKPRGWAAPLFTR